LKNSKKSQRILKDLEELYQILTYYSGDHTFWHKKYKELYTFCEEMALDTKERDTRLAKRLKKHWELNEKGTKEDS
jgi:hypothetical protein